MSSPHDTDRAEPQFDDPNLAQRVEDLSVSQIDALPFGVVRLDARGKITLLSQTEARQSGLAGRNVRGLAFFTELAPCMGTPAFLNRFEQARRTGSLDIWFRQIGDFADAQRELEVRVLSAAAGGVWVFIRRST
ncbi:MAG TPA: hypothetical protein VFQ61_36500 [Polyangiaceae bacterium]|nr:hypothetical protein [Polyangiaceae bacterium]